MTLAAFAPIAARPLPGGVFLVIAALGLALAVWTVPADLSPGARAALAIAVLAMAGWAHPKLPDTLVALAAGLALVLAGVVPDERLFAMLGSELIWLLLAAFVIAAVIRDSGLALRLAAPVFALRLPFAGLIAVLTLMIAATALVLPSTSGRRRCCAGVPGADGGAAGPAAGAGAGAVVPDGDPAVGGRVHRGGGRASSGGRGDCGDRGTAAGLSGLADDRGALALIASAIGAGLVLVLFVPRGMWGLRVAPPAPEGPMTREQRRIAAVAAGLVGMWMTEGVHGVGMSVVALGGALVLLTPPFGRRKPKEVFRTVDLDLILFMAMAALVAEALMSTGADRWLAGGVLAALPAGPGCREAWCWACWRRWRCCRIWRLPAAARGRRC